jgi:hypothetical protein
MSGVDPKDAKQISDVLRTRTSDQILEFTRGPEGSIAVLTRDRHGIFGGWTARRVGKTWELTENM